MQNRECRAVNKTLAFICNILNCEHTYQSHKVKNVYVARLTGRDFNVERYFVYDFGWRVVGVG